MLDDTREMVWREARQNKPADTYRRNLQRAYDDLRQTQQQVMQQERLRALGQMASGIAGFTGTLTVKMVSPTPLFERIDYEAGVEKVEGRKILCWGTAKAGDTLLAEASCLFISPRVGVRDHLPLLREQGADAAEMLERQMGAAGHETPPPAP